MFSIYFFLRSVRLNEQNVPFVGCTQYLCEFMQFVQFIFLVPHSIRQAAFVKAKFILNKLVCVFFKSKILILAEKKNDCVLLIFKKSFLTVRVMMAET